MSKKSPFFPIFGFGAIFWGLVRVADTISWKSEKYVRGYSSGVPKKPWMNKFEQTRERKIGGMECQKMHIFGSEPFSEGWYGPQTQIFWKTKNTPGDIHLDSPKHLTRPNLNKPATRKFGGTLSQKSPILALKSLKNGQKTAKYHF